jgi:hypothetical protein
VKFRRTCELTLEEDEPICCQDCGRIIYYDKEMKEPVTSIDDISAPPYITESGDLFCSLCGPAYDEPSEEEDYFMEDEPEERE